MSKKEDKDMASAAASIKHPLKRKVKKPKVSHNKFANMNDRIWAESNEQSKKNRGASGITYRDIFRG